MTTAGRRDWTTDLGIGVVGLAAAILTFTTLRDLGLAVGIKAKLFDWFELAWLLPVTIDAAGIVAARVWLRGRSGDEAVRFAQRLTVACIGLSVSGNAGQHVMAEFTVDAPWWVVVLVTAVPPAMLGAVVHLGHLLGRAQRARTQEPANELPTVPAVVPAPVPASEWARVPVAVPAPVPAAVPALVPVPVPARDENVPADVPGPEQVHVPAVVPVPVPEVVPDAAPADVPDVPGPDQDERDENAGTDSGTVNDEEIVEWLRERAAEDRAVPGIRAIRAQFSVGAGRADRLRKTVTVPRRLKRVP